MGKMIKIETTSGFCCELPEDALDDMELVDILAGSYANEAYRNHDLANHLLGAKKKDLYSHLRAIHGKVPATAVDTELGEIIQAFGKPGKNC
jgi:hypothetical protein